jgi:DNA-binding transcriptional LysR family regulator
VTGHAQLAVNAGDAYQGAVLAGLGIGLLVDFMAREEIERGTLVRLLPDWRVERLPLYLAFPPNRHLSTRLRVFVDWVVELLGRYRA